MSVLTSSTILFLLSVGLLNVVRAQRSASRETGQQGPGASGGFMPPGQARKMGSGEFMPPGQAKKMQGMGGSGEGEYWKTERPVLESYEAVLRCLSRICVHASNVVLVV